MKPPRNVDDVLMKPLMGAFSPQQAVNPITQPMTRADMLTVKDHLIQLNKTLNKISFGAAAPDPVNPGKTVITNNSADRNIDCWKLTGIAPVAANTDFTLSHGLGRIPVTIGGQDTQQGAVIYRSPVTPWTTTTVTLRSTVGSAQFIVVLI